MSQFHINRDGTSFGIYEEAEARALFAAGTIQSTDLAWCQGMPSWLPAPEALGLATSPALPETPPWPAASPATATDPRYAAPSSGSDPTAPAALAAATSMPMPPRLHWTLVMLFTLLTFGVFLIVWIFVQTTWIRKIDPTSRATWFYAGYTVLAVVTNVLALQETPGLGVSLLNLVCTLGSVVLLLCGMYSIRRSMVDYFNTAAPIGLNLSSGMTFFFNTFYFQYHMTRLARWKATGVLTPP